MTDLKEYKIMQDELKKPILMVKETFKYDVSEPYNEPRRIVDMLGDIFDIAHLAEEYAWLVCMSSDCKIIGLFEISHGSATHSVVSTRAIMKRVLMTNATGIIMVHCHPSGNTQPSDMDLAITKKLEEACKLLDIEMNDHIIIGCDESLPFYSFREYDLLGR